jgi:hypothetical protein
MRGLRFCIAILMALVGSIASASSAPSSDPYHRAPPASWVKPTPLETVLSEAVDTIEGGVAYLLMDVQAGVLPNGSQRYVHWANRVLNRSGIEDESHVQIEFNPASDRLVLHSVEIWRDGRAINQLGRARETLMRRESSLDSGILDGWLTLSILLEDVRVGDVVSVSYTRERASSVLGGKFFMDQQLQWRRPVSLLKLRLMHPANRPVFVRQHLETLEPQTIERNGVKELVWEWRQRPGLVGESGRPVWHRQFPAIQFSEYRDWAELAAFERPLYRAAPRQLEIDALVAKWMSATSDEAQRIVTALRFVQDEIRYTGLEMGEGAYVPHDPSVVLRRRFGDCKDKALVLTTLLNRMGIAAFPALVDTDWHEGIEQMLPSPGVFDHVIVKVLSGGKAYWLDATRTLQGGALDAISQAHFGSALVLEAGVTSLERIPPAAASQPLVEAEETFDLSAGMDAVGTMTVVTKYRGREADGTRRRLQTKTLEEVGRGYLDFYRDWYPGIRLAQAVTYEDDRETNEIVVKESYEIEPAFSTDSKGVREFKTNAHVIDDYTGAPDLTVRTTPLAIKGHPAHVVYRVKVRLPDDWSARAEDTAVETKWFRYASTMSYANRALEARYEFQTTAPHVDANDVPEYAQKLREVRDDVYYKFTYDPAKARTSLDGVASGVVVALILAIALCAAYLALARRFERRAVAREIPEGAPVGVRGWMLLPAIGLFITPCVCLWVLYECRSYANASVWKSVVQDSASPFLAQVGLTASFALSLALVVVCIHCACSMLRRERRFPSLYIVVLWAGFVWGNVFVGSVSLLDPDIFEPLEVIALLVRSALTGVLWTLYMLRSVRVRATFTRPAMDAQRATGESSASPSPSALSVS